MPMSPRLLRPLASRSLVDADAAAYIAAVESEDTQALEPAVRNAITAFVIGCKQDGIWDAIKASCILMGARTLSGALTPLVGAAPTNNNFAPGDYNRKTGLVGDGATTSLDSNRAGDADDQNDCSLWVFPSQISGTGAHLGNTAAVGTAGQVFMSGGTTVSHRLKSATLTSSTVSVNNLIGMSRNSSSEYLFRGNGTTSTIAVASDGNISANVRIFSRVGVSFSAHRLVAYGLGSSIDLALLDARVSSLYTAIGAALAPAYADADVNAYITAVETADGQAMETGVRDAINDFVVGCKQDGIWGAIKASCILMGARTLSGALTPLAGAAPTNNGPFVSGDYNRKTGLVGNGTSKYLDSNRNSTAQSQDSFHLAVYVATASNANMAYAGENGTASGASGLLQAAGNHTSRNRSATATQHVAAAAGFFGISRQSSSSYDARVVATNYTATVSSQAPVSNNIYILARNSGAGTPQVFSDGRIAFYSIGDGISVTSLGTRVTALYDAIGAAI